MNKSLVFLADDLISSIKRLFSCVNSWDDFVLNVAILMIFGCLLHRLKGSSSILKPLGGQSHSPAFKVPGSLERQALPANSSGTSGKETLEQERVTDSRAVSRVQAAKPTNSQSPSTSLASSNSVVGLYSSSTDPVHVPSPDSRSSSVVGAIKREVGVVGVRRQSSEDSVKHVSEPGVSFSNSPLRRDYSPSESFQSLTAVSKTDQLGQTAVSQSASTSTTSIRSSISNQFSGRPHQAVGHQKGIWSLLL